jgi:transcriptional regulator with XRE-family HTH domain
MSDNVKHKSTHLFGQQMRQWRKAQGKTLREVANAVGRSIGFIHDIESGRKQCPVGLMSSIRKYLQMDTYFIVSCDMNPEIDIILLNTLSRYCESCIQQHAPMFNIDFCCIEQRCYDASEYPGLETEGKILELTFDIYSDTFPGVYFYPLRFLLCEQSLLYIQVVTHADQGNEVLISSDRYIISSHLTVENALLASVFYKARDNGTFDRLCTTTNTNGTGSITT